MNEENAALTGFLEALTCSPAIYSWHYDSYGVLRSSNCPDISLHKIFEFTGCYVYMMEQSKMNRKPLILSAELGLMWCAAFGEEDIYVIGPVSNMEISRARISEAVRQYERSFHNVRMHVSALLRNVPVISSSVFFQLGVMLHYLLTGEKLSRSDLQFQSDPNVDPEKRRSHRDRHQVWMVEQALMEHVRKGDMNYAATMARAGMFSEGGQISTDDAVKSAVLGAYGFVRLCTHAAIEGGLSPETAYTLGDAYSQSLLKCRKLSEVRTVNHAMYEDYINRVHAVNQNPDISPQIRSCMEYIELHAEDELTLSHLSGRVGYTSSHLSRRFKAETGENIRDYIRRIRIERARGLLESTDKSIAEIAEELHFCSSTHFSDNFRRLVGVLPKEYRAKVRKV